MTTHIFHRTGPVGRDVQGTGSFRQTLARIVVQVREMLAWHETRQQLRELDERLLADVGLTAEEARREIEKPFWQR